MVCSGGGLTVPPGLRRYAAFANTLQQSRGFGSEFRFPDRPSGTAAGGATAPTAGVTEAAFAAAPGAEDDDLYS